MRSVNYIRPPVIGFSCCIVSKIFPVAFAFFSISWRSLSWSVPTTDFFLARRGLDLSLGVWFLSSAPAPDLTWSRAWLNWLTASASFAFWWLKTLILGEASRDWCFGAFFNLGRKPDSPLGARLIAVLKCVLWLYRDFYAWLSKCDIVYARECFVYVYIYEGLCDSSLTVSPPSPSCSFSGL